MGKRKKERREFELNAEEKVISSSYWNTVIVTLVRKRTHTPEIDHFWEFGKEKNPVSENYLLQHISLLQSQKGNFSLRICVVLVYCIASMPAISYLFRIVWKHLIHVLQLEQGDHRPPFLPQMLQVFKFLDMTALHYFCF